MQLLFRQVLRCVAGSLLAVGCGGCERGSHSSAATVDSASGETRKISFVRDVAPLIFAKCSGCHHPGEAAPFSLLTYEDARRRAKQLVEVTQKRLMPPWLPEPSAHDFVGDRRLSDGELQTLKQWVETGMLRGDDAGLPQPPAFAEGWQAGKPELILESPTYQLAAGGSDVFRNFVVTIEFDSPRWVQSIELRPENPRVTHHARLGIDSSSESLRRDAEDPEPGYAGMAWGQDPDGQLVIWAPGLVATAGSPGVAWRLNPKSSLVLHTHLQPSGKPELTKFRIGIRFAEKAPVTNPVMLRIGSRDIDIPAGAAHHIVSDVYKLPIDVDLLKIFPHAHSLCRELKLVAELPDGTRETLISIPRFDENWHDMYEYRRPIRLPRGTRLVSIFAYDNTEANSRNRHRPPRRTTYGSNADDEMADINLQVTPVYADQRAALIEQFNRYELQSQVVGFRRALELHPQEPWSQEALAACYVGLGKPAEAVKLLEQRLANGPAAVFPVVSLGMALVAVGDVARAESQFRHALLTDAQYPLAWLGLGKSQVALKQPEKAESAFRRAIHLAPGLLEARLNLADLLVRRGQLDEASTLCSTDLNDGTDAGSLYLKLGEIDVKRRQYDRAIEHFETARRLAPYTHPPKVLLAVYCFQNGDAATARKMLLAAFGDEPNHPVAVLYLGQTARRQKQNETAREYLERATGLPLPGNWPDSHKQRFLVLLHSERVQLAEQIQDIHLARDAVTRWIECDPDNIVPRKMQEQLRRMK